MASQSKGVLGQKRRACFGGAPCSRLVSADLPVCLPTERAWCGRPTLACRRVSTRPAGRHRVAMFFRKWTFCMPRQLGPGWSQKRARCRWLARARRPGPVPQLEERRPRAQHRACRTSWRRWRGPSSRRRRAVSGPDSLVTNGRQPGHARSVEQGIQAARHEDGRQHRSGNPSNHGHLTVSSVSVHAALTVVGCGPCAYLGCGLWCGRYRVQLASPGPGWRKFDVDEDRTGSGCGASC